MHLFLSHISEESPLALRLKDWIESTLIGQCEVFVSSDAAALPAGTKWLEAIDQALKRADLLVVLCSRQSMPRPWVNFETGCAWSRQIPILPICHSGISKGTLPRPISEFQALDINDENFGNAFFAALAKHLRVARLPPVDGALFRQELAAAIAQISISQQNVGQPSANASQSDDPLKDLPEDCWMVLGQMTADGKGYFLQDVTARYKWGTEKAKFIMDELVQAKMVDLILNLAGGSRWEVSKSGRKELYRRGLL